MRKNGQHELFGAIHLGSEQAGVQVVEYKTLTDMRVVDRAFRAVSLGEETFKTGKISFQTLNEICELLRGYRRIFNEYGVKDCRLAATTAIREARNQRYIIDQIRVKTGFQVEVVDMPKEIYYKYCALFKVMQEQDLIKPDEVILFVDISSGGLGFTLYKDNQILYQQNIHIGTLRIKESFDKNQRESIHFYEGLHEFIISTIEPVREKIDRHRVKRVVLSGNETDLVLKMLNRSVEQTVTIIEPAEFAALYADLQSADIRHLTEKYGFPENRAEMVFPSIILYQQILNLTAEEQIVVLDTSFIDGFAIHHIGEKTQDPYLGALEDQIISLAHAIGRKYDYDVRHAMAVCDGSLLLFDHLTKAHGLGKRDRFLLKTACILHDIGKYINLRSHYFYSYRLILSSDIFGFSEDEKHIMANVAYYHSKVTPSEADPNFHLLSEENKALVAKLVAIIRLADALDRSHHQKISKPNIVCRNDEIVISHSSPADTTLENWTFADKTLYFEEVYGMRARLERNWRVNSV